MPGIAMNARRIIVAAPELAIRMDAEVAGSLTSGKYRLRKQGDPNDRSKLHLVPLVMAMARFPDPRRQDTLGTLHWPLAPKSYVVSQMDFAIMEPDGEEGEDDWEAGEAGGLQPLYLYPLRARILHALPHREIDLAARFKALRTEEAFINAPPGQGAAVVAAIRAHLAAARRGTNTSDVKDTAQAAIALLEGEYGPANMATLREMALLPPAAFEYIHIPDAVPDGPGQTAPAMQPQQPVIGVEGRTLERIHSYKERDPRFVRDAKKWHAERTGGRLICECCGADPEYTYGERGRNRIEAHHRVPVEQLLPDTELRAEDLSMLCPSCHDVVHARRPWLSVDDVRVLVQAGPHLY